jgi:hypothetical protein
MKDILNRESEVKKVVDQVRERDGEIQRLQQQFQVRNMHTLSMYSIQVGLIWLL